MAYSWQEQTYASGTTDISVDIEYLDKSYINVYLGETLTTDYAWTSSTVIRLNTALSATTVVTLVRRTDKSALYIVFADGAAFIRENLDTQNTQFLHLAQELVEGRSIDGFYGDLSMNGYRITNLGAPVDDEDATNKEYVDELVLDETTARQAADASLQSQITGATPVLANEMSVVTWHGQTITNSVDVPDGVNAFSIGPQITIAPGQSVNLGAGSYWNVLGNVFESDELYNVTANNLITEDTLTTVAVDEIVVDTDLAAAQSTLQGNIDALDTRLTVEEAKVQSVALGGTGATTAEDARTNLGLGSIATQSAASVAITGGSIAGINDLAVADGGTGASTPAVARTNLGAAASGANTDITSLQGSSDGSNAATGKIGEILDNSGSSVALTSGTPINAASITLTAGDWDVSGSYEFDSSGNGPVYFYHSGINTVSQTVPDFPYKTQEQYANATTLATAVHAGVVPSRRILVSTTTTVYLVFACLFGSNSVTGRGYIRARRAR